MSGDPRDTDLDIPPAPGVPFAIRHRRHSKTRSEYLLSATAFGALAFFILS